MAKNTPGSLGTFVEEKIHPYNPRKRNHWMERSKPKFAHLECCPNNQGLIMDHSFWELQNGTSTNFWSDSWQQLPTFNTDPNLRDLIPLTTVVGLHRVIDF
jgi:hypothetical protein